MGPLIVGYLTDITVIFAGFIICALISLSLFCAEFCFLRQVRAKKAMKLRQRRIEMRIKMVSKQMVVNSNIFFFAYRIAHGRG
jgi:hypothetical protein